MWNGEEEGMCLSKVLTLKLYLGTRAVSDTPVHHNDSEEHASLSE